MSGTVALKEHMFTLLYETLPGGIVKYIGMYRKVDFSRTHLYWHTPIYTVFAQKELSADF